MVGGESTKWTLNGKPCDSCKSAAAALFCRADSAFLCLCCDSAIHAANKLASRHARVWLCEVCEQAPTLVTCKADAASLCETCDRDIHTANPLARRHERVAVVPFYDTPPSPTAADDHSPATGYLSDSEEAASWLLPSLDPKDEIKSTDYLFSDDVDPYLDLDLMMGDQKPPHHHQHFVPSVTAAPAIADGVVPEVAGKINNITNINMNCIAPSMVEGVPCYEDVNYNGSKPFLVYNFNSQSVSQSISSSSLEVGVVPDHNTLADVSTASPHPVPLSRADRDARVLRYKEKRKNRKFEKTIRYASRKAYAETRPRIKGRFAKRYDVVPSF